MKRITLAIAAVALLTLASTSAMAGDRQHHRVHHSLNHRAYQRAVIHEITHQAGVGYYGHEVLHDVLDYSTYRDSRRHNNYHGYGSYRRGYYGGHHGYRHYGSGIGVGGNGFSLFFGF